ncbi:MAG: hypothetical protein AAB877_02360 [Patescibacteria group bacterium]
MSWEQIYNFLGITEFIYFISSPSIQEALFPVKLVFYFFTLFFLGWVIYFYFTSSYLQYQFSQDVSEFFSWQPYGLKSINKKWNRIVRGIKTESEAEYKIAIVEADDFLYQTLETGGFRGETFEELANDAGRKMISNFQDILEAHQIRNAIVYGQDYDLPLEKAKKILSDYENAIKNISIS